MSASTGIVILAAGNSSRLGSPKQLLQFQGTSLIRHVFEAAVSVVAQRIVVVTGSYHSEIAAELDDFPVHFVQNWDWENGMGSSIKTGIGQLIELYPDTRQVLMVVSDQPFVSANLFFEIIQTAESTNSGIVASTYDNTLGTPVLFTEKYFAALLSLDDAHGAKKILKQFADDITSVPFPKGGIDIDTVEDYQKLLGLK